MQIHYHHYFDFSISIIIIITFRHLARNPFYCDCSASWLVEWMTQFPVETSGVRCEEPKVVMSQRMSAMMMMVMMMLMNMPGARGGHVHHDDGDGDEDVKVIVKMVESKAQEEDV